MFVPSSQVFVKKRKMGVLGENILWLSIDPIWCDSGVEIPVFESMFISDHFLFRSRGVA
jgi:hypothetical protein